MHFINGSQISFIVKADVFVLSILWNLNRFSISSGSATGGIRFERDFGK